MANFKQLYNEKIKGQIQKELGLENVMQVPRLDKIVLNVGLGEALQNGKLIESSVEQVKLISGQMPVVTKAKKSIANFKLREGVPIGVMVTLRGNRMYQFLSVWLVLLFHESGILRGFQRNLLTAVATIQLV